jgi:hypothetical protein
MQEIEIHEIADELGMKSNELIKRVQLIYKDIKSSKSVVSQEVAQEIFNTIVFGKEKKQTKYIFTYSGKKINLYFCQDKIDITMLENIAKTYKQPSQKEFMIRSFNFSELSIVKILVAGLVDIDLQKYIELKCSSSELSNLFENINKVLNDVDFEDLDNKHSLENFKSYVASYKPQIIYIEGVTIEDFVKYKDIFEYIKKLTSMGTMVEIGFCEIASGDVDDILNYFRSEQCNTEQD